MTYNPEATRSKLVEGIPFLFFFHFHHPPVTCHIHHRWSHVTFIIPAVTCHKNIPVTCHIHHPRSHVTKHHPVTCLIHHPGHMSQKHPMLIRGSSEAHPRLIRGSSEAHPGAGHMSQSPLGGRSHVTFIDYSRYAFLFNKKSFFFSLFFLLSSSSFGHTVHCHHSFGPLSSYISRLLSLSHSIHLD